MKYSELVESKKSGIYVAVNFSDETCDAIAKMQAQLNVPKPLAKSSLHCTIVYSKTDIEWEAAGKIDEHADIVGFEIFKTRSQDTDENVLVLLIKSKYLDARHEESNELGASYDFPEYKAHITLSYNVGDFKIDNLPVPDFDIEIVEEYVRPLKE